MVLWLAFAHGPRRLSGATVVGLANPAHAITAIGKAATTALTTTHR